MKHPRIIAIGLLLGTLVSCSDEKSEKHIPGKETIPVSPEKTEKEEKPEANLPKKETHVKITSREDKLIDQIWKLPEVQELSKKIENESKGKRHLTGRISSEPSDDQEYYGISISEDNGQALATYFDFRIYPDGQIYYYDAVQDQELTLKEWRTQKK
ncbi:hypothetical protein [Fluviicola sp.]|jgi:hypothetical protein|uniref:hypothetical protein n=1 Tax=Fluviicola sp. TaxID=1917219 RepID=UPI00282BFDC2|nr:hypothetical protein [Fluviicola sp.]MDR0802537.1 hypothetical protein [Fluviicola sp.]